jgi:hypothetical protein
MKIVDVPLHAIDWASVPVTERAGEHGHATSRTVELGNVRVRIVEYSPGYLADHWCERGHVVLVLDGELTSERRDAEPVVLRAGMSYTVADGAGAHRSRTTTGARLFIVD